MSNYFPEEQNLTILDEEQSYGQMFPASHYSMASMTPNYITSVSQADGRPSLARIGHVSADSYYPSQPISRHFVSQSYPQLPLWPTAQPIPQQQQPVPIYVPTPGITAPIGPDTTRPYSSAYGDQTRILRSSPEASIGNYTMATSDQFGHAISRSSSPSGGDLREYGFMKDDGTWKCAYPGCTSRAVFTRGCDLRKHYKRHTKSFFCRFEGCPQSIGGGFSSRKDLARHEAKHNPGVLCEWQGCDRVFSRVDNMRDHVKRIHLKRSRTPSIGQDYGEAGSSLGRP